MTSFHPQRCAQPWCPVNSFLFEYKTQDVNRVKTKKRSFTVGKALNHSRGSLQERFFPIAEINDLKFDTNPSGGNDYETQSVMGTCEKKLTISIPIGFH